MGKYGPTGTARTFLPHLTRTNWGSQQMDSLAGGRRRRPGSTPRTAVLGSVTVPGEPEEVSRVRGFIARTLASAGLPGVDSDAATLLTSELVTNAILHTDSGKPGGCVSVVIRSLPDGLLVEVIDD